jgi:hypothetical protein
MSVAVIQELVTKFGFMGSTKPLTDYNVSLGSSIKLLGGMLVGLEAAAGAFSMWADGVLTGVDALGALSRETKVAVGTIQELDYVASQTQSSAGAMESTLRNLTKTIGTAALKGSDDFARLGISVRGAGGQVKTADAILDELRQRFRALNLSMAEQESFTSALGIDSSLLQMLNRTNAEMAGLRDRARELGTLTGEQVGQAEDYKKSLDSMWFSLNHVKQLVAVGVAPELGRLSDSFTQLIADNKDWVVAGIQFAVKWIGNILAAFNRLLPVIALIGAGFLAAKIYAIGFAGVMAIIGSPVVLITAAIVALLLIIDDLIVAFQGGKSVIADFFQEFLGIDIVKALKWQFEWVMKWIGMVVDGWKLIGKAFGIGDGPTVTAPTVTAPTVTAPTVTAPTVTAPTTIPPGTMGPGAAVDNRQVNQDVKIQINTNDAQAAGRAVEDSLQRQLNNASTQLAVGGR